MAHAGLPIPAAEQQARSAFVFSMTDDIRTTGGVAAQLVVRTSLDDRLFAAPVHFEHLFF